MNPAYTPQSQSDHGRNEELQWARLFATGSPIKGMLVVFLQKMCAAFHEFEPAYLASGLNEIALPHFRRRLAARVAVVLTAMDQNGLHELAGYQDLVRLQQAATAAESLQTLAALAEPIHLANHTVTDALEAWSD
jgi:hypothetical protein